eukprot:CAMPEP_0174235564 /NCGR_PEP_ID=MMETSP0417-20130205/4957_1 /TAXON_ID=242541 /ORGANISM="Mayorella sp, Strain BSH-02190019" /LENGTH=618 /DNA_ID=CAMNT_0015314081 /DNA_START=52 /DNA_END=1905 /DNA_ORIENTATION=+
MSSFEGDSLLVAPDTPPVRHGGPMPRRRDYRMDSFSLDKRSAENLGEYESPVHPDPYFEDQNSDDYSDDGRLLQSQNELEAFASHEYEHGADRPRSSFAGGEYDDEEREDDPFLPRRSFDDEDELEHYGRAGEESNKAPIQDNYKIALRSLYFLAFIMYADLSIILPTALRYFQSMIPSCYTNQIHNPGDVGDTNLLPEACNESASLYLAFALATYSTCQFIFAPLAGFVARRIKRMKVLFLIMITCCGIGNIVYSTAGQYGVGDIGYGWSVDPIIAELGRALAGFGAASIGTSFAYIALVTEPDVRTEHIATFRVFGNIGLLVSPGLAFVLTFVDFHIGALHIDGLNAAGWIIALFCVIEFFLLFFFMKDPPPDAISGEDQKGAGAGATSYWSIGVIVNLFFAFYLGFESITFEFMLAPLTASRFYWSPTVLALYMFIAGCSVLPGILTVKFGKRFELVRRVGERFFVICSWVFTLLGLLFMWAPFSNLFEIYYNPWGEIIFCIGGIIAFWFFTWGSATQPALVSLIIPPASRVLMMPWVAAMTSAGRIVGPIWSQWALVSGGADFMFPFLFILCGWCIFFTVILWPRFASGYWKIEHPELAEDQEEDGIVVFAGGQ